MTNPLVLTNSLDAIEVRHSHVHGHGAFATRHLPRSHVLGVYEGRRYTPSEVQGKDWDHALTYLFGLSDGSLIDGGEGGNATRHINHSCEPNCEAFEMTDDDGETSVFIQTRRPVRQGEELFIDYSLDVGEEDPSDYPCRCGSAQCRGSLVALAQEVVEVPCHQTGHVGAPGEAGRLAS
jgi:hypothetical protein